MNKNFTHLTIVGLGLIGGSIAMAARKAFPDVVITAVDPSQQTREFALNNNIVDVACEHLPAELPENNLLILACHINPALELMRKLAPMVAGKNIVVSDISSVKRPFASLGEELMPQNFIPAHPMAGREISGITSALADLFKGKLFILTPSKLLQGSVQLEKLEAFYRALGATTKQMQAEEHDRVMAFVSHFPQLYSLLITKVLNDTKDGEHILECHGGGLADQLRLAASPYTMWGQVFEHNADNLQEVMSKFGGLLNEASSSLGDAKMADWFAQANHVHKVFAEHRAKLAYDPFQSVIKNENR